ILMTRVSKLEYDSMHGSQYVGCRLEDVIEDDETYQVDPAIQRKLKMVRTDLNRFTDSEIFYLVWHGYAVARRAWLKAIARGRLAADGRVPTAEEVERERAVLPHDVLNAEAKGQPWTPPELATRPDPDALNRSEKRSLTTLWDRRDPVSWWSAALLFA